MTFLSDKRPRDVVTRDGRPLLIAHRGGAPNEIDNSPAAFEHALALDVDMLEFDVRQARDGTLVLLHDPDVFAEGRRWVVRDTPFAQLREVLPWLLTLDEYLERFGHTLPFNLDLKSYGFEAQVVAALGRHGLVDHATISSGHTFSLRRLSRLSSQLQLGLSRGHARTVVEFDAFFAAFERYLAVLLPILLRLSRAHAAMLHYQSIDARLVSHLHRAGFRVFAWTVDDPDVARSLAAMGVDSITSNHPALIREALDYPRAVNFRLRSSGSTLEGVSSPLVS